MMAAPAAPAQLPTANISSSASQNYIVEGADHMICLHHCMLVGHEAWLPVAVAWQICLVGLHQHHKT